MAQPYSQCEHAPGETCAFGASGAMRPLRDQRRSKGAYPLCVSLLKNRWFKKLHGSDLTIVRSRFAA